jgi:cysteine desulfuration protein SufE
MSDEPSRESCLHKQDTIKQLFLTCESKEERYAKIIDLGKEHKKNFSQEHKTPENLISGCQSTTYIRSFSREGRMVFEADSEALISQGLVTLLILAYNEEPPEILLTCPPAFLDDLEVHAHLTPGRSNGLASMFMKMKHDALQHILSKNKTSK